MPGLDLTADTSCSLCFQADRKFSTQPRQRSSRQYGSGVKTGSGRKCDSSEITIEFPASSPLLLLLFLLLLVPSLQALLLAPLCLSDGSITGAMLRELLKLSLSGCVSSNVGPEPPNLLTVQEKRAREEGREEKVSPPLLPSLPTQMTPTGSHRALNFASRPPHRPTQSTPSFSVSWPPDSDLQTEPYWSFLLGGA